MRLGGCLHLGYHSPMKVAVYFQLCSLVLSPTSDPKNFFIRLIFSSIGLPNAVCLGRIFPCSYVFIFYSPIVNGCYVVYRSMYSRGPNVAFNDHLSELSEGQVG